MNILKESKALSVDIALIVFMFNRKSSMLESNEEHESGMFSTQQKISTIKSEIVDFITSHNNSLFYLFFGKECEEDLKIVASNIYEEIDIATTKYAIIIDEDLSSYEIKMLSLSAKVLTVIVKKSA